MATMATMGISERMELHRAALAGARRGGAGSGAARCARHALQALEDQLDEVPVGRRLAWVSRAASKEARRDLGRNPASTEPGPCGATSPWLDQALAALDAELRPVLQLTYGDGLTAVEIGRLLGCSVEQVTSLRDRGRRGLAAVRS